MSEEHGEQKKDLEMGVTGDPEPGTRNPEQASGNTAGPGSSSAAAPDATPHPFEALLDEYPLREPFEDPVWSVRIIKGWMYFLAFNFAWMLLIFILGIFYD